MIKKFIFFLLILFSINLFGKGFYCIKDDRGEIGVRQFYTSTIQNTSSQWIKKIIDLSNFPEKIWDKVETVYISIYCTSLNRDGGTFDEEFEIIINGKTYKYPLKIIKQREMDWHEFCFAKEDFILGKNEIIVKKAEGKSGEYLYIGIDTSIKNGNSYASYDNGKTWEEYLNVYYRVEGEYLIRLNLITEEAPIFNIEYKPGKFLKDEYKFLKYVGSNIDEDNILNEGEKLRLEWDYKELDRYYPFTIKIEGIGSLKLDVLDKNWGIIESIQAQLPLLKEYPSNRSQNIKGIILTSQQDELKIEKINLTGRKIEFPKEELLELPKSCISEIISIKKMPKVYFSGKKITLDNSAIKARFEIKDNRLKLVSLFNNYTKTENITNPENIYIFLIEKEDGKVYRGLKDFNCKDIEKEKDGFKAYLFNDEENIEAKLKVKIEEEGLRLGLEIVNKGNKKEIYKVAFPHFQGLVISDIKNDWYFYPIIDNSLSPFIGKGGIYVRSGYGIHYQAGFQIIDIFSPEKNSGIYLRIDDKEGWFKILSLIKYMKGDKFLKYNYFYDDQADILKKLRWIKDSLEKIEGIGFSCEYLGKEIEPGKSLILHDGIIASHSGCWKDAMKIYSEWAHNVWRFRQFPSKLSNTWVYFSNSSIDRNGKIIFKDEDYLKKTYFNQNFINPCEFWYWWEPSRTVGPWGKPIEEYAKEGLYPHPVLEWSFRKDPISGKDIFLNNTGDYDYSELLGGLKGLQEIVKKFQQNNKIIIWYTDPIRLHDITKAGEKYGKEWTVIKSDGKPLIRYEGYTPCVYNPVYREWITDTMKRVIEETGVDGIRYDEGGLGGWVCYSNLHQHTHCEQEILEWPKAFAELCRLTSEKIKRDFILTTEFPGYDYLMQFIDGTITHYWIGMAKKEIPFELDLIR
ncbi:MAG: DUF6259 domain-containing protein, partial [Candidatus Omnitrophica bacterium]|nr:DUF6259 domain-containing protein [Candidatus Omnitrophota bacterium]